MTELGMPVSASPTTALLAPSTISHGLLSLGLLVRGLLAPGLFVLGLLTGLPGGDYSIGGVLVTSGYLVAAYDEFHKQERLSAAFDELAPINAVQKITAAVAPEALADLNENVTALPDGACRSWQRSHTKKNVRVLPVLRFIALHPGASALQTWRTAFYSNSLAATMGQKSLQPYCNKEGHQ